MKALDSRQELAKPMVAALVVLAVAGVAWAAMVRQSHSMAGMDMGLGPIEHGPLPFNLMRSAAVAGARYGLSCLGCNVALMVAMVLIGMSSLWWAVMLGIVVLIYKLAPPLRMRHELVLSLALAALGVAYVMMA
jgi:predicted metal-binding membrane protein